MDHPAVATPESPTSSESSAQQDEVLLSSGVAARITGVCTKTLILDAIEFKLNVERTKGGHRRYRDSEIRKLPGLRAERAAAKLAGAA